MSVNYTPESKNIKIGSVYSLKKAIVQEQGIMTVGTPVHILAINTEHKELTVADCYKKQWVINTTDVFTSEVRENPKRIQVLNKKYTKFQIIWFACFWALIFFAILFMTNSILLLFNLGSLDFVIPLILPCLVSALCLISISIHHPLEVDQKNLDELELLLIQAQEANVQNYKV